jgi:fructokinase
LWGGISTDLFGRMIADHALSLQVELCYATHSEHQTTLAFVRHVEGEPGAMSHQLQKRRT